VAKDLTIQSISVRDNKLTTSAVISMQRQQDFATCIVIMS